MHIGLIFTVATDEILRDSLERALNLADSPETVEAVTRALEAGGHTVTPLNTDSRLPAALCETRFDIVFTIATGYFGESCQANIAAMLEYLNIPHTGPSVLAEALTQHKHYMKNILLASNLPTPPFQMFRQGNETLDARLRFPLIVKLPSEGGSLGMTVDSIVHDETELRTQIAYLLKNYRQGALVEEYIEGREFTVTVLGNTPAYILPIVERLYRGEIHIQLNIPEPADIETYKRLTGQDLEFPVLDAESVAPANLSDREAAQIEAVSLGAYKALACQDWARIDLRMDSQGNPFIIDVNLEPTIAPEYAVDKAAHAAGWTYPMLINRILEHAVERYPHLRNRTDAQAKPDVILSGSEKVGELRWH